MLHLLKDHLFCFLLMPSKVFQHLDLGNLRKFTTLIKSYQSCLNVFQYNTSLIQYLGNPMIVTTMVNNISDLA